MAYINTTDIVTGISSPDTAFSVLNVSTDGYLGLSIMVLISAILFIYSFKKMDSKLDAYVISTFIMSIFSTFLFTLQILTWHYTMLFLFMFSVGIFSMHVKSNYM